MASSEVYQPKFNFKTRGHTFICYDYKSPQQLFSSWRSSSSYWLSSCPPLLQSSDFDFIKYSKQKSCLIHAAKNVWGHIISRSDPPSLHLISPLISVYLGNIKMDTNLIIMASFLPSCLAPMPHWARCRHCGAKLRSTPSFRLIILSDEPTWLNFPYWSHLFIQ